MQDFERRDIRVPARERGLPPAALRDAHAEQAPTNGLDFDLICFSHLRWNFVYQRPQHLLTRFARKRRVHFIEEPIYSGSAAPGGALEVTTIQKGLQVVVPLLPPGLEPEEAEDGLRSLVTEYVRSCAARSVFWYYTPMALSFTRHLNPIATVYDCMDELSAFRGAPEQLRRLERELCRRADLMFAGGESLYLAKRSLHANVHAFPSSVDVDHFGKARGNPPEPPDQARLARPRFGFFGVIDERFDTALLDGAAALRPEWQFVIVGPVAKIDPRDLPARKNIHYLGAKSYAELPSYIAGWDVATLPFARNEATRYISPTKTPEYLAAGRPVVSTSIRDVVSPYADAGLVRIADDPESFAAAGDEILAKAGERAEWLERVDRFLSSMSWDRTWSRMNGLLEKSVLALRAARRGA